VNLRERDGVALTSQMPDECAPLDRFLRAQDQPEAGFEAAMAELRAGAKRGHWIWYVFPQIAGLGSSSASREYAIRDATEAAAYLSHPVLATRLRDAIDVVAGQLQRGMALPSLMGSEIDALKLVSSLTLFQHVGEAAEDLAASELAKAADHVLTIAERQGYPRCSFTERALGL